MVNNPVHDGVFVNDRTLPGGTATSASYTFNLGIVTVHEVGTMSSCLLWRGWALRSLRAFCCMDISGARSCNGRRGVNQDRTSRPPSSATQLLLLPKPRQKDRAASAVCTNDVLTSC